MNIKRDFIYVSIVYIFAILYTIFIQKTSGVIFFFIVLYGLTFLMYYLVSQRFNEDKEKSLDVVLQRLDKTQKESEETYTRFLSLSKTLGSGLLMVDVEGTITFSNKDVENYFGINLNNKDYNEITDLKPLYQFINKAYLTEDSQRKQITFNDRYFDLIATPIYEHDSFTGTLILIHDITLIHNAEKMQKQFTADVSHELKTPITAIKGFSEILSRDDLMKKEDQTEFISLIQKETERMEVMLNDLMIISKLDRIDYELELNDVEIKTLIEESVNVLKTKINEKNLTLEMDVLPYTLHLDKGKMTQVLLNIIKNAISYTDEGFIKIKGNIIDHQYVITIEDSGIGISEEKKDLIFKRFYRIDKARSRDTGGSGLGLSISKNVIVKHEGTITVESKVNKGSKFTITLPIKDEK